METLALRPKGYLFFYLGFLVFFTCFLSPNGSLIDIGISYVLKNELSATSTETARLKFICSVPVYLGLIWGLLRDRFSPFDLGDRGYQFLLVPILISFYLFLYYKPVSYQVLILIILTLVCLYKLLFAACLALVTRIAQQYQLTGQLSSLLLIAKNLPESLGASLAALFISQQNLRAVFLISICFGLVVLILVIRCPQIIRNFDQRDELNQQDLLADLKRLGSHRPLYPALTMLLLFNFAPGFNTPLQYHLTERLHAPDASYGLFLSIFFASLIPGFLLYGILCKHVTFTKLLRSSVLIAIPQMLLLGLIQSKQQAYLAAIPMGLVAGMAYSALYDLTMRSCPKNLQGSCMMLAAGALAFSDKLGDLVGAIIYNWNPNLGLFLCGILTTCVYSLMLPCLLWIRPAITCVKHAKS